jgi:structural maintenance of chromosome 2
MEFVFGNTIICPDPATAKKVTFDPVIKMKSVTVDGDVYDPSGTLSGGSKPKSDKILVKVQELRELEKEVNKRKREMDEFEKEQEQNKVKVQ